MALAKKKDIVGMNFDSSIDDDKKQTTRMDSQETMEQFKEIRLLVNTIRISLTTHDELEIEIAYKFSEIRNTERIGPEIIDFYKTLDPPTELYCIEPSYRQLTTARGFFRYFQLLAFLNRLNIIPIVLPSRQFMDWKKELTLINNYDGSTHDVSDREELLLNHWQQVIDQPVELPMSLAYESHFRFFRFNNKSDVCCRYYCHRDLNSTKHAWYSRKIHLQRSAQVWINDVNQELLVTHIGNCCRHDKSYLNDILYLGTVVKFVRDSEPLVHHSENMD